MQIMFIWIVSCLSQWNAFDMAFLSFTKYCESWTVCLWMNWWQSYFQEFWNWMNQGKTYIQENKKYMKFTWHLVLRIFFSLYWKFFVSLKWWKFFISRKIFASSVLFLVLMSSSSKMENMMFFFSGMKGGGAFSFFN